MKFTIDSGMFWVCWCIVDANLALDDEIEPETDEYVTSEDEVAKPKASKKSSKKGSVVSKKSKSTGFVFDFDDGETVRLLRKLVSV